MAKNWNLGTLSKLWWSNPWTRIFVISTIPLSLIDDVYTWTYIKEYGLAAEANPVTRFFFQSDLGMVWAVLNALVPFICMALLGSLCESRRGDSRSWIATAFSALFTLKILTAFYHTLYFNITLRLVAMLVGFLSFISVRHVLLHEGAVKWAGIRRWLWIWWLSFSGDVTRMSWTRVRGFVRKAISETGNDFTGGVMVVWKRSRASQLLLLLLAFLVLPVLALRFIDFLADLLGIRSLPSWAQGLGMVTRSQGAMFLLTFVFVLAVVCVLMYVLLSVFSES